MGKKATSAAPFCSSSTALGPAPAARSDASQESTPTTVSGSSSPPPAAAEVLYRLDIFGQMHGAQQVHTDGNGSKIDNLHRGLFDTGPRCH